MSAVAPSPARMSVVWENWKSFRSPATTTRGVGVRRQQLVGEPATCWAWRCRCTSETRSGGWNGPNSGWSPPLEAKWFAITNTVRPAQGNSPASGLRESTRPGSRGRSGRVRRSGGSPRRCRPRRRPWSRRRRDGRRTRGHGRCGTGSHPDVAARLAAVLAVLRVDLPPVVRRPAGGLDRGDELVERLVGGDHAVVGGPLLSWTSSSASTSGEASRSTMPVASSSNLAWSSAGERFSTLYVATDSSSASGRVAVSRVMPPGTTVGGSSTYSLKLPNVVVEDPGHGAVEGVADVGAGDGAGEGVEDHPLGVEVAGGHDDAPARGAGTGARRHDGELAEGVGRADRLGRRPARGACPPSTRRSRCRRSRRRRCPDVSTLPVASSSIRPSAAPVRRARSAWGDGVVLPVTSTVAPVISVVVRLVLVRRRGGTRRPSRRRRWHRAPRRLPGPCW